MILDDFIEIQAAGLYCKYGNFYLDPQLPVAKAVISHAHADHAVSGNRQVWCTSATAAFMKHRYKKYAAEEFHLFDYSECTQIGDVKITFISAGHILGSAQILLEYKGERYLYTGDYKLQKDATCEAYHFAKADVLITETTFADPDTIHPDPSIEILKLNNEPFNIMLGAYALGKSQTIIQLINQHCPSKKILLHHSIMPFAKIYESYGIQLGDYAMYDRKSMKQHDQGFIYMVPPMVFNSYFKAINVKRAFATGWKKKQEGNDLQLYISDHADWNGILEAIEKTEPKQVWTLHGDGTKLKSFLSGKIEVKILN